MLMTTRPDPGNIENAALGGIATTIDEDGVTWRTRALAVEEKRAKIRAKWQKQKQERGKKKLKK